MTNQFYFELPACRGIQAGRPFYLVNVPFNTLKRLIAFDTGNVLDRSQREVNPTRAKKVSRYIQNNVDSFVVPALIGVIDRRPEYVESNVSGLVGILKVDMDSDIKLFDGQHRATGIMDAITANCELGSNSVPLMLFMEMGLAERQMAFSDINGHTVKPSTSISDTYNQRNDLPQLVVEMAKTLPCFEDFVDFERNVVAKNSTYLFPIKILKDATARLLGVKADAELSDEQKQRAKDFWMALNVPMLWEGWKKWRDYSTEDFRNEYISSHGVFLNALGMVGSAVWTQYASFESLSKLNKLCIKRENNKDLLGRCICPVTGNMRTDTTAIKLTAIKMLCTIGCPVESTLQAFEKQYFPDTEFPKAENLKAEPQPEPEVACYQSNHYLAPIILERLPDLSGEQIDDLAEKFDKVGTELGMAHTVEDLGVVVGVVVSGWNRMYHSLPKIRADLKKAMDPEAA